MILFLIVCITANSMNFIEGMITNSALSFVAGHLTHATLVTAGIIISLLFFDRKVPLKIYRAVLSFVVFFFVIGYLLRPYFRNFKNKKDSILDIFLSCNLYDFILFPLSGNGNKETN